jgi:GNAT superfamily N-acetyltransferase
VKKQDFREEHVLADGARVTLRFIQPDDAEELAQAFERLSTRSRYQRFFVPMPRLSDEMIRYLTDVDGENHVAIVATTESLDLKRELGLGVARYVRLADAPSVAEAAVTVVDEAQGRGIGKLLLAALARVARERGVTAFRGMVLADNAPMRALLSELSAVVHPEDRETLIFDVPLDSPPHGPPTHPPATLRRLLRAAAESLGFAPPPTTVGPPPPRAHP